MIAISWCRAEYAEYMPNACIIVRNKCSLVRGIQPLFRRWPSFLCVSPPLRPRSLTPDRSARDILYTCDRKKKKKKKEQKEKRDPHATLCKCECHYGSMRTRGKLRYTRVFPSPRAISRHKARALRRESSRNDKKYDVRKKDRARVQIRDK